MEFVVDFVETPLEHRPNERATGPLRAAEPATCQLVIRPGQSAGLPSSSSERIGNARVPVCRM